MSFPNLTLPPAQILVNQINLVNAATLPQPLTTSTAVFGDPQPYGGDAANTVIPFGTTNPAVYGVGTVNITYNRIDVSKLIDNTANPLTLGSAANVSDLLTQINTAYHLNLQTNDIIDAPIDKTAEPITATLRITTANLIYTGNAILTSFTDDTGRNDVPLSTAMTTTTMSGLTPP